IDRPTPLRFETDARPIRPTALVAVSERRSRRPRREDELRYRQARVEEPALERHDVVGIDELMIDLWHRVLPDQAFGRDQWPQVALDRAHIDVRELEPGSRKRARQLIRIRYEAPRYRLENRCFLHVQSGG